jgi:hypothetical protein
MAKLFNGENGINGYNGENGVMKISAPKMKPKRKKRRKQCMAKINILENINERNRRKLVSCIIDGVTKWQYESQ